MKWLQNGNLAKLVAFFVIAVVITCTVSFAANGWQSFINDELSGDNVVADNKNPSNNNTDEEKETDEENIPVVLPTPKYYHAITGLETDLETSLKRPLCRTFGASDPLYGISSSYLTIERWKRNGFLLSLTQTAHWLTFFPEGNGVPHLRQIG